MRALLWFASLVALLVSGCLDDSGSTTNETPDGEDAGETAAVPEGFEESGSVMAKVSPGPFIDGAAWCEYGCIEIPFTVNETVGAQVKLTWGLEANDFDLVLMNAEGEELATSGSSIPERVEQVAFDLQPGDYVIGVVPFAVTADDYTVSVVFS